MSPRVEDTFCVYYVLSFLNGKLAMQVKEVKSLAFLFTAEMVHDLGYFSTG